MQKPVYVTNYRIFENEGKTDEELADELVGLAEGGATLCDVMGDYYDRQPEEITMDETAIKKQMELIEKLHKKGVEVLMSSHVLKFIPAERVLEIAKEHERRGADICKIVTGADTMEEQIENLRIVNLLKENLNIPFLFLSSGECQILRRIGGEIMGKCIHYLTHGARWIMIAALAGQKTEIDLKNIYVRNVRIIGSTLRSRTPETKAQILAELVEKVFPKIETGEVKPTIHAVLPITEAEAAHDILYKGQNVGKVVLEVK